MLEMKIDLVPGAIPYKNLSETVEPRSEGEFTESDRQVVRARIDQTVSESLCVASGTCKEEGRKDKMGHRSERVE